MSSVIVKGMEMPENCNVCPFIAGCSYCGPRDGGYEDHCPFDTDEHHGWYFDIGCIPTPRPDWCPLEPAPEWIRNLKSGIIPEHWAELFKAECEGRLIVLPCKEESDYAGLKVKYVVVKAETGELVENCFVLRPDKDPAARLALEAYAQATDNQVLASDITEWIGDSGRVKVLPCQVVDAVEVVRCGECRYMQPDGRCTEFADDRICPSASDFCSYGQRREEVHNAAD